MPLSVSAAADRPLFPPDRDVEDHVYCLIEFPAPGYDAKDPFASRKKIGVQYASINGNGFGGYGEIVFGTEGTLVLEKEQDLSIIKGPAAPSSVKVSGGGAGGPTLDTQASGAPTAAAKSAGGGAKVSRGYTEELEHWAWCIRNPRPGEPAPLRSEGGPGRRRDCPDDQHGRPPRRADRVQEGVVRHPQRRNAGRRFRRAFARVRVMRLAAAIRDARTAGRRANRGIAPNRENHPMYLSPEEKAIGKENFYAAIGSKPIRRDLLKKAIKAEVASGKGLGPMYFGYGASVSEPVRVGVIGTGDEGSVLLGAINPKYIAVKAIADIRPYNVWRAFNGDFYSEAAHKARPGLMSVYGWKTDAGGPQERQGLRAVRGTDRATPSRTASRP